MDVTELDGVGKKTAKQLKENGFDDVMSIARVKAETLKEDADVKSASKIIKNAREAIRNGAAFKDGEQLRKMELKREYISTGSPDLDEVLGGGVPTGWVTTAYGQNSSGKTQLAIQLCVNTIKPEEKDGLGKSAIFIDTEHTFTAERFLQMAEAEGLDEEDALSKIFHRKVFDTDDQLEAVKDAKKLCDEEDVGLVVVDSVIAQFRTEFSGRNELTERQQKLGKHIQELAKLADSQKLSVFLTNQSYEDPGQMFGDPTKPVGGNTLTHSAAYILYMQQRSKKKKKWCGRLVDSPNLPVEEALYTINKGGIEDF